MKKLLALLLVVVMALSMALAGCSNGNEETTTKAPEQTTKAPEGTTEGTTAAPTVEQKELVLSSSSNPDGLDVHEFTTEIVRTIINSTYATLTRQNGNEIVGDAAESWTVSDDGLTWTFKLRSGMTWADGKTPLNAQNFVDSFMRHMSPNTPTVTGENFALNFVNGTAFYNGEVEWSEVGIKALDDLTLEFKTNYYVDLPRLMYNSTQAPIILSEIESWGEAYGGSVEYTQNCGPYVITEWVQEESVQLVKNENYWNAENVMIPSVRIEIIPSTDTAALMFDQGEIDMVRLSTTQILSYQDSPYAQYVATGSVYVLTLQQRVAELENQNMKAAFGWLIDREAICSGILYGAGTPATRMIADSATGFTSGQYTLEAPNVAKFEAKPNVDNAKAALSTALTELNLSSAEGLSFGFLTGDDDGSRSIAEYFQDTVKNNLGIDIEINMLVSKQRWAEFRAANYELTWHGYTSDGNGIDYIDGWATGGNFYQHSGWVEQPEFAQFDKLVNDARYSIDGEERANLIGQAEQLFLDAGCSIPVYFGTSVYLVDTDTFAGLDLRAAGNPIDFINCTTIA